MVIESFERQADDREYEKYFASIQLDRAEIRKERHDYMRQEQVRYIHG